MKTYSTQVPGKCIVVGEHAVLRGVPALVIPLRSRVLDLSYVCPNHSAELAVHLHGEHGQELQLLVWGVLERACEMLGQHRSDLKGDLTIKSSIPVGAGMGASAALCVAITKWLNFLDLVSEDEMFEFARSLENLFHGESSGLDIAVCLEGQSLRYVRNGERAVLDLRWMPHWYISYSGQRGVTIECVNKVKALISAHPERGAELDARMREAVRECETALTKSDEFSGFEQLAKGLEQAREVFVEWGLTSGAPETHMALLKKSGAVAVKPTGSGGGGYVLSLWKTPPPAELLPHLIPC